MKTQLVAGLIALFATGGCYAGVRGSGVLREEVRPVEAFEGVEVCCGIDATVTIGEKTLVKLETDDNLLPLIRTEVKKGRLVAKVEDNRGIQPSRAIRLTVVTPRLTSVEASGGGTVVAEATGTKTFTVSGSGGAVLDVKNLKADQVVASGSGGTELILAGVTRELMLDVSGGTSLKTAELLAENVSIEASGGVSGTVRASAQVTGSASGGVNLHVKGNPARGQVATSGGADVDYEK